MTNVEFETFWDKVTVEELVMFVEKWNYCIELHKFGYGNHALVLENKPIRKSHNMTDRERRNLITDEKEYVTALNQDMWYNLTNLWGWIGMMNPVFYMGDIFEDILSFCRKKAIALPSSFIIMEEKLHDIYCDRDARTHRFSEDDLEQIDKEFLSILDGSEMGELFLKMGFEPPKKEESADGFIQYSSTADLELPFD